MRTSAGDGCCPWVMDLAAWGMVLGVLGLLFLAHLWGSLTWSPLVEESHEGPGPVPVSVFSAFLKFQSPCLSHASSVFKINTLKESEGPSVSGGVSHAGGPQLTLREKARLHPNGQGTKKAMSGGGRAVLATLQGQESRGPWGAFYGRGCWMWTAQPAVLSMPSFHHSVPSTACLLPHLQAFATCQSLCLKPFSVTSAHPYVSYVIGKRPLVSQRPDSLSSECSTSTLYKSPTWVVYDVTVTCLPHPSPAWGSWRAVKHSGPRTWRHVCTQ